MNKQRFYIDTNGNDDMAYKEAMQHACRIAESDLEIKKVILLLITKNATGWFERIFGKDTVKQLYHGAKFKGCNILFKFSTKRTYQDTYTPTDIVITCGIDSKDIFEIDEYFSVRTIIAIPGVSKGIDEWVKRWQPVELRGNQQAIPAFPELSCIVIKALEDLTDIVNLSTGINHPSDEEFAKTFILALHKYESEVNAKAVSAYLTTKLNWEHRYANDVEKLITMLNDGKRFMGGRKDELERVYQKWKNECIK